MSNRAQTYFYGLLIALTSLVVGMVIASRLGLSPVSFAGELAIPKTNSAPLTGPLDAGTFREIAREASPTVVSIRTQVTRQASGSIEEFFGLPFGGQNRQQPRPRPQAPPQVQQGAGSGFIIDRAGYILTNNHVVDDATVIEVFLAGMSSTQRDGLAAKVVGRDVLTDTALLQLTDLPEDPLPVSKFGDSAQLQAGDWVMAIGNPFSLSNTVTVGVVSAVGRQQPTAVSQRFEDMIQTDAAINRGNSGGPLLNVRGEVVGMNTQIVSDMGGGNLGIGFAVPVNTIRDILPQLMKGKVVRGKIGVLVDTNPLTRGDAEDLGVPAGVGALISEVNEGPARKAGIRRGDVVVEFNGKPVKNSSELVGMVTRTAPGTTVPVKIIRAKKLQTVNVTIDELDIDSERNVPETQLQEPEPVEAPKETGFGMTIEGLTAAYSRQLKLPQGTTGALVSDVEPAGAAARAGLRPGDVIVEVNDQKVGSVDQVTRALDAVAAGRTARIVVFRGGREVMLLVRKK
jgi:serine protease Do